MISILSWKELCTRYEGRWIKPPKTFPEYLKWASRNSTFSLLLWESQGQAVLCSECSLRAPPPELPWGNVCLKGWLCTVLHISRENSVILRVPDMAWCEVQRGEDAVLGCTGNQWISSAFRRVVGQGQEWDVLVQESSRWRETLSVTSDMLKILEKGSLISQMLLCVSLLTRSRRTHSFTGGCCSIPASLRGVASAPTAWSRGCVRTVFWCCW